MNDGDRRGRRRRQGERRAVARGGSDRRRGERRRATLLAAGTAVALTLAAAPEAGAQIYTRKNPRGVIEATNVPASQDFRLTYPGKGTLIHSASWRLRPSYNGQFNHHILAAAAQHGVSVDLVRAVIQVESDFDALARSSKGAQGLMQLMPDTARALGVTNAFDPRQNIFGGVRFLRQLLDQFGDVSLALAAYNAGVTAVARYRGIPPFKETQDYVSKIQSLISGGGGGLLLATAPVGMTSYVPGGRLGTAKVATSSPSARPGKAKPAPPRTYYRWKDATGVLHVSQDPPAEGVVYSTIRALD